MKKINENTKVTLTLGQLKKLVKEGTAPAVDPVAAIEEDLSDILDKIDAWRTDGSMEHWQYSQLFDLADDALAKLDEVKKPEAVDSSEGKPVTEEFDTDDGWDCDEIRDSGLLDTLRKCANLQYTLDKCTRASANFGDTLGDLKAYVNELAEEMMNAVADFPDEDEEQPQDAMGDDEEIEVME